MFLLIILYSLSVQLICPNQAHCITGVSVCICSWAGQIKPVNIYWAASGMRSGFSKMSTSNKIDRKRREWSVVVIVQLHPRSGGCSGLYPCGTSYYALNLKIGAFSSKPQCYFGRCTISTIFWISKGFWNHLIMIDQISIRCYTITLGIFTNSLIIQNANANSFFFIILKLLLHGLTLFYCTDISRADVWLPQAVSF